MSETLQYTRGASKAAQYEELLPQLKSLIGDEPDLIANLANVTAALKEVFGFFWVGFYLVKADQLVLGPFQGPIACTRIRYGRGVCGTAWEHAEIQVVPDVDQFPGHIACSSLSKSEIVIPIFFEGRVVGVLDLDSEEYNTFDEVDARYLDEICRMLFTVMPDGR